MTQLRDCDKMKKKLKDNKMSYEQYVPYTPAETRYDKMPYRRCGRSGLKLPAISLGLWHNFGDITPFGTQQQKIPHRKNRPSRSRE